MMDEVRLRTIEQFAATGIAEDSQMSLGQAEEYLRDLIAALRGAWRERDQERHSRHLKENEIVDIAESKNNLLVRAARAEAERDTLQAMWNTLADAVKSVLGAGHPIPLETLVKLEHAVYSEHPDTLAPARKELERLRAVREAAEALLTHYDSEPIPEGSTKRERLAAALAVCAAKDPAR